METRANYVLIGAFAIAGFLGLLGFLLWFAQFELDRQFDYYDVRFSSVSGLSRASEVRFSGLLVGQVVSVQLSPDLDGTVTVRLEVAGDTPVRTDSIATIESMGVTGVSYVGISAGDPREPLLSDASGVPEIKSGRSALQSLTEGAPQIIEEAVVVMQNISAMLDDANQQKVQTILDNLAVSSGELSRALTEFSGVSQIIGTASEDIASFAGRLTPVVTAVEGTLANLDTTLQAVTTLSGRVETSLDVADDALRSGRVVLDSAQGFMTEDLPALSQDIGTTIAALREQTESVATDTRAMLGTFTATGAAATARLTEAEGTLKATEAAIDRLVATLDSVDAVALSVDGLITGEGTALVAETRALIASADSAVTSINTVAQTDLPAIVADIRGATDTVNRVTAEVGAQLTSATGRIDGLAGDASKALEQVTQTFASANTTLAAIDTALITGERSLQAAERAFDGAGRILNDDAGAIIADLRQVMQRLDSTIATVSDDIPAITADLRQAAETARRAFDEMGTVVSQSGASVQDFARSGLPQYTQLARETRSLIASLESLTRQIERDPARFFFSRQTPEFRR